MRSASLALLILLFGGSAYCEQTIINVPSADVLDLGKLYTELDLLNAPSTGLGLGGTTLVARGMYGFLRDTEAGINVGSFAFQESSSPSILATVKSSLYHDDRLSMVLGGEGGPAFNPNRWLARIYAKGDYALPNYIRIGAGPYASTANYYEDTSRVGVLASGEMTYFGDVNPVADWVSGCHPAGLLSFGLAAHVPTKQDILTLAAARRNCSGEFGFILEFGRYW